MTARGLGADAGVEDHGDGPGAVLIERWYVLEPEARLANAEAGQAFG